jgi:hypothetical protein
LGGGAYIELGSVGLGAAFEDSPSVEASVSEFNQSVREEAKAAASAACSSCSGSGHSRVDADFSISNLGSTDVTLDGDLFSVGRSTFARGANCRVSVDCKSGRYRYDCTATFSISDEFTDPLRFGETFGIPMDIPLVSDPYPINYSFTRSIGGMGQ